MQQTIYLDVLISVNLFVNYFLLLTVRNFFNFKKRRYRVLLGALIGAGGSLIILLPRMNEAICAVVNLLLALACVATAFLPLDFLGLLKATAAFYLCTFAYAGVMLGIWYFVSPQIVTVKNSIVYFNISPLALALLTVATYFIIKGLGRITGKKETKNIYCSLKIEYKGNTYKLKGKIDTGCNLKEPFSQRPVIVAEKRCIGIKNIESSGSYRVLPFNDLSGKGLLNAFKPDKVTVELKGKQTVNENCFVGVYDGIFDNGIFDALVSPEILSEGREDKL